MTKFEKSIEMIIRDVNDDQGFTIRLFENFTNLLFSLATILGVPLLLFMLFQIL